MANSVITNLKVLFSADTTQFKRGITDAEKGMQKFQAAGKLLTGALGAVGIAASAAALVNFGKKAAEAADVELKAQAKLLVALKGREDITNDIIAQAAELQKTTLFGDEESVNAAANLAAFVKSGDQLKQLLPVVQDTASALGMDLASAATLVGKSIGSSTNALKRYGIDVQGAAGSAERAQSAIQGLSDKFKGQAEAMGSVGLGPITQLRNMVGDLVEDFGKMLMPVIQDVANWMKRIFPSDLVKDFRSGLIDLANWFIELYNESGLFRGSIQLLGGVFNAIWETVKGFISFSLIGFKGLANTLKAVFTGDFKSIPGIIQNTLISINQKWQKGGQDIIDNFAKGWENTFKPKEKINLIDKSKAPAAAYKDGVLIGESFSEGIEAGKASKYNKGGAIGTGAGNSGLAPISGLKQGAAGLSIYQSLLPKTKTAEESIADSLATANAQIEAEQQRMFEITQSINGAITQSFNDMAQGVAEAMGNMIAGVGGFDQVGKALLGGIGTLAIQLGQIAIGAGIGIEAIKTALRTLSGPVAIAAGVALVALGSAIKGAVTKMGTGGGGGGRFSGGSGTYDTRTFNANNLSGKQQKIQVEVVGSTSIRNKDIYIAYSNAQTSKKMNT